VPSFVVNAPADPVKLMDGTATVMFTVTNASQRALDGTVLVHAAPPTGGDWFAIVGERTRRYQPGGVEQVAVKLTIPAGTAAGTYDFRLDAKSEANPDEDYTEGPGVGFEVPPPPPKPVPWWRKYWWVIVIAAVVVIGIVVALVLAIGGAQADIPERNCVQYDPETVRIEPIPPFVFFAVNADAGRLALLRTPGDADRAQTLAKAHTTHCRIGAGPQSIEYWLGNGDGPRPPRLDCISYDPDALEIRDLATGFLVTDGGLLSETVATRQDADDLLALARAFDSECFIGRFFGPAFSVRYWE
jgi:hypothetical protein